MKEQVNGKRDREKRSYPPFWERAVPFLITLIVFLIIGLLVVAVLVALGLFP